MTNADRGRPRLPEAGAAEEIERGRMLCRRRAWASAFRSLSLADRAAPLGAEDLEQLAVAAFLIGEDGAFLEALDRAHHAHRAAGDAARAARCAFWVGLRLLLRGEAARATGWLARAQRLVECEAGDCVERGYLLVPVAEQHLGAGDYDTGYAVAADAAAIGDRFGDGDLVACARHIQGRALMWRGRAEEGLALLDEAMVAVTAGELSPIMTGLIYCSVIDCCQQIYEVARAREWTAALAQWCAEQPEMISFTGRCLVHRAEIMQFHGAWQDAVREARHACERHSQGIDRQPPAAAFYQQGEVHRLRGAFAAAEKAYRSASRLGWDPQPGLALLRLAQGRAEVAAAGLRRALAGTTAPLQRARLLPAHVEAMLAVNDLPEARGACRELEGIAQAFGMGVLEAMAAHARGAIALAEGEPRAALGPLRRAGQIWQQVEAPYSGARTRELVGLACRALGDHEGAALELDAARAVFQSLGAAPDLARIDRVAHGGRQADPAGLTPRERQVLNLIAAGKTNKVIAAELALSVKTVDRHVANIFTKIDVPSRAAATAYAYEHGLV